MDLSLYYLFLFYVILTFIYTILVKDAAVVFIGSKKLGQGGRQEMKVNDNVFLCTFVIQNTGLAACCVTDQEYPHNTANQCLTKALDIFKKSVQETQWKKDGAENVAGFKELIDEFRYPEKVNKVAAIQKDVDETKDAMQKNIQAMMERGEKIDDLDLTTQEIEFEAKKFHDQAVTLNTCCCCKCAFCANKCASCSRCSIQ